MKITGVVIFLLVTCISFAQNRVETNSERKAASKKLSETVDSKMQEKLPVLLALTDSREVLAQAEMFREELRVLLNEYRFTITSKLRLDLLLFTKDYLAALPLQKDFKADDCFSYYNDFYSSLRHVEKKDYDKYMNFTHKILEKICPQKKTASNKKSAIE